MTVLASITDTPIWPPAGAVWWCLLAAAALLAMLMCLRAMTRLHTGRPTWRQLLADTNGTATIEFALLFPVALFFVLALTQVTLLMGGYIFVNYAAYTAARSAVVKIPADYGFDEPPNVIYIDPDSPKLDAIRRAAAYALIPVAGRLSSVSASGDAFADGLRRHYQDHGRTPPRWIDTIAADRFRYVEANTEVVLMRTTMTSADNVVMSDLEPSRSPYTFGPREAITVRVEHQLYLSVPYVRALFVDGRHDSSTGIGAFTDVNAQATMVNHGIVDALPPLPPLPRSPSS